jgi:hypothetical protein
MVTISSLALLAGMLGGRHTDVARAGVNFDLGTPIPQYAFADGATRMNVAWINTVDEDGGLGTYYNLRYRLKSSTPDVFESYTYIGGGGPPDDLSIDVTAEIFSLPWGVPTRAEATTTVMGLSPATAYCFSVRATRPHSDGSGDFSPWSGEVCAATPAAPPTPTPAPLFGPSTSTPTPTRVPPRVTGESPLPYAVAHFAGASSTPTPAPTKPDLDAVSIAGPASFSVIVNQVYTATVSNNGTAANGNVEVVVGMSGVLQAWDTPIQNIGLSCALGTGTGANTWTCEGGTLAAGQTATIQFRVHADSTGKGTIVLSLNPSRTLDESDYGNNLQILNVTVTP